MIISDKGSGLPKYDTKTETAKLAGKNMNETCDSDIGIINK